MNYVGFERAMGSLPCFTVEELRKRFPGFDTRRLVEWQKKGYIFRLRNRFYCFANHPFTDRFLAYTANRLCRPSYLSLEWALHRYGIVSWHPRLYTVTSCTTRKTQSYRTPAGTFRYRHLKPDMYFGYRLERGRSRGDHAHLIAQPEKAIVDYMYFHHELKTLWDLRALEWDKQAVSAQVSLSVLFYFAERSGSAATASRVALVARYLRYGGHYGGGRPVDFRR